MASSLICHAILIVYALQISHVFVQGSTSNFAPYWLFFGAMHANAQLAYALHFNLLMEADPVLKQILDGRLRGWAALDSIFGLIHVAVIWLGSWIL